MIDDIRLPEKWSRGSSGGPEYRTDVVMTVDGSEDREQRWADPIPKYEIAHNIKSPADISALRAFHFARRGALRGFLLRDWIDYTSAADGVSAPGATDQPLGTGNGVDTEFQLVKRYPDPVDPYDRAILWPVDATLIVAANGTPVDPGDYSFARGSGLVVFDAAPDIGVTLTAGFAFDVPVRFAEDMLSVSWDTINSRSAGQVPLVGVRD